MSVQTLEPRIDASPFLCQIDSGTVVKTEMKPRSMLTECAMLHLTRGSAKSRDKEGEEMDLA